MRLILCAVLLATATAAQAAGTTTPVVATPPAASAATGDGDKLICRRENTIGSNVRGKKICRSKRDLEAAQISGRIKAQEMSTPTGGGGSSN